MIARRVPARRLRGLHPAIILVGLDALALVIAGYLSVVALVGELPSCGLLSGCDQVATSQYAHVAGIPVAVLGVLFTATLLTLALGWWRTGIYGLLLGHYGLSLIGLLFNLYLFYLQVAVIGALCIWCLSFEATTLLAFLVTLVVYLRQPKPES